MALTLVPTGLHPKAQGKSAKQTPPWFLVQEKHPALKGLHPKIAISSEFLIAAGK